MCSDLMCVILYSLHRKIELYGMINHFKICCYPYNFKRTTLKVTALETSALTTRLHQGIEKFLAVWEHTLRCKNFLRDLTFKDGTTLAIW